MLLIRNVSRNKDFQRRSNSSVFFVGRLLSQISQGALAQKVCGALTNCDIDLAVKTKVRVTLSGLHLESLGLADFNYTQLVIAVQIHNNIVYKYILWH